jgi:hypothetical protein
MRATATVEGGFTANDVTATQTSSIYHVTASMDYSFPSNKDGHIEITLDIPKGTPPYSVDVATTTNSVIDYCLEESVSTCTTFRALKGSGSGTIKITSISPYLEGTFSGTLPEVGGSGTRTISNGEFKAGF